MTDQPLSERYGKPTKPRSWWVRLVLPVIAVAAGVTVAIIAYRNFSQPVSTEVKSFAVRGDHSVRLTFTVTRDQPDKPVDCVVTASTRDATELSRKEVYIPAGGSARTVTTVLRTGQRAANGDVYGCSYNIPRYLAPTVAGR